MAAIGDNKDNVVVPKMKLERMLSMKGGKGEGSYVNNSQAQVIITLFSSSLLRLIDRMITNLIWYLDNT